MGAAYQIGDQEIPYFLTFQGLGRADVFTRKAYRHYNKFTSKKLLKMILENPGEIG